VTILDTLTVEETAAVNFGAIPGNDGICGMDAAGNLSGTKCSGSGQLGQFSIAGSDGQSVHVSVEAGDSVAGLTFQPQLVSGSDATLVEGAATASVGGELSLSGATPGPQALTYYLTVNYN